MKKIVMILCLAIAPALGMAQTSKGDIFLEANTGNLATGNTSFALNASDGNTAWSIGIDGGVFIMDDLAIKAGIGYSDLGDFVDGNLVYKLGAKYYLNGTIPLGADLTGITSDGNGASWFGLQGGYAIFLGDNVAIEPALRYNITLDEADADSIFQALVGFVIFL
ncbi:MAG: hypothetical protein HRT65_11775 [Flavobacteriaceae bacterium]|uniref:hypothetical protein n=1 Tax=Flagellimonas algarum TaxID=3230298 RepID=UPI003392BF8E|nr:hypothetical protein [Flavobacteriaceae bacterium]